MWTEEIDLARTWLVQPSKYRSGDRDRITVDTQTDLRSVDLPATQFSEPYVNYVLQFKILILTSWALSSSAAARDGGASYAVVMAIGLNATIIIVARTFAIITSSIMILIRLQRQQHDSLSSMRLLDQNHFQVTARRILPPPPRRFLAFMRQARDNFGARRPPYCFLII